MDEAVPYPKQDQHDQDYEELRQYVEFTRKEPGIYVRHSAPERYAWDCDTSELEALASDFSWPRFGHNAEIASLKWHLPLRDRVDGTFPEPVMADAIVSETVKLCSDAASFLPDDFMTKEHYLRVVADLEWTSSPGFPYMYDYPTNASFFEVKEGIPSFQRVEYVWTLVSRRLIERDSDPIRLFIKPEPHSKKKLEQKRYRLISSVSVVDQIIDHMLFGEQNYNFMETNHYTPVRVGWGWMKGGWRSVSKTGMMACDKSGWDWTVKPWLVALERKVRERLILNCSEEWKTLVDFRYRELFEKNEFVTSGGVVFRVKDPGLMKSGCVNTIVSNSIMQVLLHVRVCLELKHRITNLWVMGDDTLQMEMANSAEYVERLSRYCILKQVEYASEFAGFRWQDGNIEPLYRGKHAFNILHVSAKDKEVFALSYNLLYWRSKFLPLIRRYFPVPDIGFSSIWDGE